MGPGISAWPHLLAHCEKNAGLRLETRRRTAFRAAANAEVIVELQLELPAERAIVPLFQRKGEAGRQAGAVGEHKGRADGQVENVHAIALVAYLRIWLCD